MQPVMGTRDRRSSLTIRSVVTWIRASIAAIQGSRAGGSCTCAGSTRRFLTERGAVASRRMSTTMMFIACTASKRDRERLRARSRKTALLTRGGAATAAAASRAVTTHHSPVR